MDSLHGEWSLVRIMTIFAFLLVLGLVLGFLNIYSPFSNQYVSPVASGVNDASVLGATGCTSANSSGGYSCSSGIGAVQSPSFFGITQFIFGNFFAGVQFLITISGLVFFPGWYALNWFGGVTNPGAVAMAAIIQSPVSFGYAQALFYIITGRWMWF